MEGLPIELRQEIGLKLNPQDLKNLQMINKNIHETYQDPGFWLEKAIRDFGIKFKEFGLEESNNIVLAKGRYNKLLLEDIKFRLSDLPLLSNMENRTDFVNDILEDKEIYENSYDILGEELEQLKKYYNIPNMVPNSSIEAEEFAEIEKRALIEGIRKIMYTNLPNVKIINFYGKDILLKVFDFHIKKRKIFILNEKNKTTDDVRLLDILNQQNVALYYLMNHHDEKYKIIEYVPIRYIDGVLDLRCDIDIEN